jgi:ketosteroid isomerase-like protein
MKIRLLLTLAGLAISFALPTFAQQTNTPDPELRQQYVALAKKWDEIWNNNDAAALAALFTKDAVLVTDTGPIYGRDAIEKMYADLFKQVHFSNHIGKPDRYAPHVIGAAGYEVWSNGEWSSTIQGEKFGPTQIKGYWGSIDVREDGVLKCRMLTWNITPAPPATASPTPSPSNK